MFIRPSPCVLVKVQKGNQIAAFLFKCITYKTSHTPAIKHAIYMKFQLTLSTTKNNTITARKVSKYRVFSGPYFPVFSSNTGKYGPEKNSA